MKLAIRSARWYHGSGFDQRAVRAVRQPNPGDWGAEVIKIEPLTGDTWRYNGQFRNRGMTGQFMAVNRNKRSLALDLKQPDGKSVLQRLIAKADVLLTNIRPAALARLGFGYEVPANRSIPG